MITHDGGAAICARVESDKRAGQAGYLHRLRDDATPFPRRREIVLHPSEPAPTIDAGQLAMQYEQALGDDVAQRLGTRLGLTARSLRRLRAGWSKDHRAYTFPMVDAVGRVVGVRLRLPTGRKLSVKGGHEGLFVPVDLGAPDMLLVAEGPSDAAALLDLGFSAIGRPSCTGGTQYIVKLVQSRGIRNVVVCSDGDGPGQCGARDLAGVLRCSGCAVRVISPPDGIKDARAWLIAGATRQDVQQVIDSARCVRLEFVLRSTQ